MDGFSQITENNLTGENSLNLQSLTIDELIVDNIDVSGSVDISGTLTSSIINATSKYQLNGVDVNLGLLASATNEATGNTLVLRDANGDADFGNILSTGRLQIQTYTGTPDTVSFHHSEMSALTDTFLTASPTETFLEAEDKLYFRINNTTKMTIDSSGDVLMGSNLSVSQLSADDVNITRADRGGSAYYPYFSRNAFASDNGYVYLYGSKSSPYYTNDTGLATNEIFCYHGNNPSTSFNWQSAYNDTQAATSLPTADTIVKRNSTGGTQFDDEIRVGKLDISTDGSDIIYLRHNDSSATSYILYGSSTNTILGASNSVNLTTGSSNASRLSIDSSGNSIFSGDLTVNGDFNHEGSEFSVSDKILFPPRQVGQTGTGGLMRNASSDNTFLYYYNDSTQTGYADGGGLASNEYYARHIGGSSSTSINWGQAYLDTSAATHLATVNTLVKRDASGDFSGVDITASGTVSGEDGNFNGLAVISDNSTFSSGSDISTRLMKVGQETISSVEYACQITNGALRVNDYAYVSVLVLNDNAIYSSANKEVFSCNANSTTILGDGSINLKPSADSDIYNVVIDQTEVRLLSDLNSTENCSFVGNGTFEGDLTVGSTLGRIEYKSDSATTNTTALTRKAGDSNNWLYYYDNSTGTNYDADGIAATKFYAYDGASFSSGYTGSDIRLKENVVSANIQDSYVMINELDIKNYTYKPAFSRYKGRKPTDVITGFIADQLQSVMPLAVKQEQIIGAENFYEDSIKPDFGENYADEFTDNPIKVVDESVIFRHLVAAFQVVCKRLESLEKNKC